MDRFSHYEWPFFEPRHAALAKEADAWAARLGYAHVGVTIRHRHPQMLEEWADLFATV